MNSKDPDLPPFVSSWRTFYLLLVGWLLLLIAFFWFFTEQFK